MHRGPQSELEVALGRSAYSKTELPAASMTSNLKKSQLAHVADCLGARVLTAAEYHAKYAGEGYYPHHL